MRTTGGYQPKHLRQTEPERPVANEQTTVAQNTALMGVLVIISRVTGFFRTWSQAYALGVTVMASCYSIANNLPNQLYDLVGAGMLTTAFLPVYISVKRKKGRLGANLYTSNLVSIVLVFMGFISLLGFIFAAEMVYTQSFSATEGFDANLAIYFFRFFVIEVVLYGLSSIFSGVLNAERDYFWGQAAPIFNNFVTTASFVIYAVLAPSNPQLALVILALGNPLGVAVQVALQIPPMLRHGIHIKPHINLRDPALAATLKIGGPSLVVMAAAFATTSVQSSASLSVVSTGASITFYARLWYTLPYAIFTVPITTALFTELSDSWEKKDHDAFKNHITEGINRILFFMVPATIYLIVFSGPLISTLASGKFDSDSLTLTTLYLMTYATSLPLYSICMYLQKVASSMFRMRLCAWANAIGAVIQIVILLTLTPVFGLAVVGFSSTAFFLAIDALILWGLRRNLGALRLRSVAASVVRYGLLGALGALAGSFVLMLLTNFVGDFTGRAAYAALYTAIAGTLALVVTFGTALLLHLPETLFIKHLMARLTNRRVSP